MLVAFINISRGSNRWIRGCFKFSDDLDPEINGVLLESTVIFAAPSRWKRIRMATHVWRFFQTQRKRELAAESGVVGRYPVRASVWLCVWLVIVITMVVVLLLGRKIESHAACYMGSAGQC